MKKLSVYFGIFVCLLSCNQKVEDKNIYTEKDEFDTARNELRIALSENEQTSDTLISNSKTAVSVAESILFPIYGKKNIIDQRPYKVNKIDGYWVINGTLSQNKLGGTFLIILNSKDGKVIKLSHGK